MSGGRGLGEQDSFELIETLAKQLGAKLIYCESTREECLARAEERGVFAPEWAKYVREWWNDYEP